MSGVVIDESATLRTERSEQMSSGASSPGSVSYTHLTLPTTPYV